MNGIYLYRSHSWYDLYLSDRELSQEELYCPFCEEYDELVCVCETMEDVKRVLLDYPGYDLVERVL